MAVIPQLETTRLRLRGHRQSDFNACLGMWSDPAVIRYITGKPSTEQTVWGRMLNYHGLWQLLGFGYWAVEEKSSGTFIGEFGFADFRRELQPSICGVPELGWALVSQAHGKGYATEALRAIVAWGDANLASPRTVCLIDPGNDASFRVAAKLGYSEKTTADYGGKPVVLLARKRTK